MKKFELKLDGKKTIIGGPTDKALKLISGIKALRDSDGYFTLEGLAEKLKVSANVLRQVAWNNQEELGAYNLTVPSRVYGKNKKVFGSKKLIANLHKELELDSE